MEVAVEFRRSVPTLAFAQRLDDDSGPRFNAELGAWVEKTFAKSETEPTIDFSGVTFVSSTILRALLSMAKRVRKRGGHLVLANPSPEVEEAFRIIGFREIFESYGGTVQRFESNDSEPERVEAPGGELTVIAGDRMLPCKDGDSLGTEGSIAAQLFAGLPGVAKRHLVFRKFDQAWFAEVPDEPGLVVRLDDAMIAPGQRVPLGESNALQIGEVRLRLHVTPSGVVTEGGDAIQDEVEDVFSKTVTWLERRLQR